MQDFHLGRDEHNESKGKRILDPGSEVILRWNKVFLCSCLVSLSIDPLFFYIPSVLEHEGGCSCMLSDWSLGILVTCLRSVTDVFYMLHIAIKFRTAYISPSSRVLGRGELVMDQDRIARRYLKSDFCVDLVATLPLPQIVVWFVCPANRIPADDYTINALVLIVFLQYIPRLYLVFPLSFQIIKTTGVVTRTVWAGAAYNLLLYMLASHVLGASWYLLSFERHATCWKSTCRHDNDNPMMCSLDYLNCESLDNDARRTWANGTKVFEICDPNNLTGFKYGIFGDAVAKSVFSFSFLKKCCYCLWWGLQNLSSYGQTLSTSTYIGETSFAILVAILGLVLFSHLIGNMQTYLQSITARLEEWRIRRRDTESWMRHRHLPHHLQERVRKFLQYKWLATHGVDEESIMFNLPKDLRRDIQRHLCLDLVRRPRDFCGEELLAWTLLSKSTVNLPSSTRTVRALTEVEAFALRAEDLKFVANQFRRLHSKKLQHTFRFYSYHWRTWAACFIQAAWRRAKKRRMQWNLSMSESSYRHDDDGGHEIEQHDDSNSLNVTILASRFAKNTRRGILKTKDVEMIRLQKPEEPDFSTDPDHD
ncbi:hypothetical protein L1987_02604 [Smallanthus sonchifolius]|uniref:Uncharacterized protein n=1 Tax=Smallanthus sonchifolius TaxID=185202 RepID=A0ACB9K8G3_9ASTR|nr:hypothetical protein L1987_02604 [Smallanthus sonchifolius]